MAAKEELVLQLFDLYWFKLQVLVNQKEKEKSKPDKLPSLHVNEPLSSQFLISKDISYGRTESPNSVLAHSSFDSIIYDEESDQKKRKKEKRRRRRRLRKSKAELEMEELKGFRELGFVLRWRIPSLRSEVDMKKSLKMWARTVASAVK